MWSFRGFWMVKHGDLTPLDVVQSHEWSGFWCFRLKNNLPHDLCRKNDAFLPLHPVK
jgi:hypothetical protein